jgi:hypothetical protein
MKTGVYAVGGTRASVNRKVFTLADFDLNASGTTKDLTADGNFEVGYELDIEDGLGELFGRGLNENPLQAQGFIGVRFVDDGQSAAADGRYRLAVRNAQGRRLYNLYEGDLANDDLFTGAAGSGSEKDRRDRQPFPLTSNAFETEPHVITIDFNVSSDITVDNAEDETAAKIDGFRAEALE